MPDLESRMKEIEARVESLEQCVSSNIVFRSKSPAIRLDSDDVTVLKAKRDDSTFLSFVVRGDLKKYGLFQRNTAIVFNNAVYRILEFQAIPGVEISEAIALIVQKRLSNVEVDDLSDV